MKKLISKRLEAVRLRKMGHSLNEVADKLDVSKSSASYWLRDIALSPRAKDRLSKKIKRGQIIAAENKRENTQNKINEYFNEAAKVLKNKEISNIDKKIICSLVYWCEGAKDLRSGVQFANSDPYLAKLFVQLLRENYKIDDKKFHACVHIHSYHNPKTQIDYWSNVTGIPKSQFFKPYLKKNSGKNIHADYQGCISIRYNDVNVSRQLLTMARAFLLQYTRQLK